MGLFQVPFYFFKSVCLKETIWLYFIIVFFSQVKLGVLKFLASDLFEPTDVLCHFIVATGDTRHRYVIIQLYIKLALQINSSTLYKSHLNDIVTSSWFNKLNKKIWSRVRDKIIERMFDLTFPTASVCLVHESPWPWSQNNLHPESQVILWTRRTDTAKNVGMTLLLFLTSYYFCTANECVCLMAFALGFVETFCIFT